MSAGYIQLVALGQQDAYLTGSPQVTYFSGVYKRHTPFVLEAYDIAFNDQIVTYGGTSICRIPPKGDLIRGLTLKAILPPLYNPGNDWTWPNPPSNTNFPILWFGLPNGTITGPLTASYGFSYYSSNAASLNLWDVNFLPYLSYNSGINSFQFTGVSNVIVLANQSPSSAFSGVFWGFDPVNYSTQDAYGNLVYNSTSSGIVTPDFNLQQAGWVQSQGIPVDPLPALYLSVTQQYPMSGLQFINFSSVGLSGAFWTPNYILTKRYTVTPGGCVQFTRTGYYAVRAGFNLTSGSIQFVGYGTSTQDGAPVAGPTFIGSYNYTVSPDPSSPAVIPILVTSTTAYYYFYAQSTGTTAYPGTYFSIGPVNETYQLSSSVSLTGNVNSRVLLYGNVAPTSQYLVTLNPDSSFRFTSNAQYVISGSLSLSNTATESEKYVSDVSLWDLAVPAKSLYKYDMTLQGRNPTYAFSLPLVASNLTSYYLTVSSTRGPFTNIVSNSFFTIQEVGLTPFDAPTYSLPQNGIIFTPKDEKTVLPATLNFRTQFSNTSNSTMIFTNADGSLQFANTMSYMLTGVLSSSNLVTSISISNSQTGYTQSFGLNLGIAPPYTISIPFNITNNALSYSVTLQTSLPSSNLLSATFLAVYPLTSNEFSNPLLTNYSYYDSVGTYLIQNADLKIGGQTVQSITGEYIELWNELNVPYENQPGLQLLTGKYDTQTSVGPPGRTYYVNLPFYFYGAPELSVPICALDRQDVEVWVTFRPFSNLTSFTVTSPTLQATIITEYAYLSNPEITWFQSHQVDYVITQTQYEQFDLQAGFTSAVFQLFFKNPVTELFFVIQPVGNLPYDYSNNGLGSLGLTFNGEDAFLTRVTDTAYVGSIEPFNHHVNFFSKAPGSSQFGRQFFMYVFSTNPNSGNPSGSINFSRIRQVLLELNVAGSYLPAKQFRVLATSQNILRVENGVAGIMFT